MKIIFFTNKGSHGAELLQRIKDKNIPVEAIFIEVPKEERFLKKLRKFIKRHNLTESPKIIYHTVLRKIKILFLSEDRLSIPNKYNNELIAWIQPAHTMADITICFYIESK